jgi:hypothetical protein
MPHASDPTDLAPPVNHVFVDYENVHKLDLSIIGHKAVSFTLLVGPRQSKLDAALVEKLFEHAASVQLVRLGSAGKNALDFILTYYVGRAVAADPTGCYHIVSKDKGFDPLIEHLQSRHISARRYDSFTSLPFAAPIQPLAPTAPAAPVKPKPQAKSKAQPPILDERLTRVVAHLRKPTSTRPRNRKKLVSYLVAYLGQKITEAEASEVVVALGQAGHLNIDEKDRVTYFLE